MAALSCVPPVPPPHLAARSKAYPTLAPYQISTLTGQNNWVQERAEAQYLRYNRRKPLSQLKDKFQTTYREVYCKNLPPAVRTQKNFAGTGYPHHQPILDTLRYQDEYLKPISVQRASDIDPRNVSGIFCPECQCPSTCDCFHDGYYYGDDQQRPKYNKSDRYDIFMEILDTGRSANHVPSFFPY